MKCVDCVEHRRCEDSFTSWIFFAIGLISTIALRVVTVLFNVSPIYGKIAWYVGVGGFFLFFVYKFRISQARYKLIRQNKLVDKISQKDQLTEEDYRLIGAVLCSLSSRKERINYFFIFALSAIALIAAIYFDFIK
ncbi:MAG: hypothetical protein V1884_02830 [Candidatus Omnitrophota bacterium]